MIIICGMAAGILLAVAEILLLCRTRKVITCIGIAVRDILLTVSFSIIGAGYALHNPVFKLAGHSAKQILLYAAVSLATAAAVFVINGLFKGFFVIDPEKTKSRGGVIAAKIISMIFIALGAACYTGTKWGLSTYGGLSPDQLLINILSPTTGTDSGLIMGIVKGPVVQTLMACVIWGWIIFSGFKINYVSSKGKTTKIITNLSKSLVCLVLSVAVLASTAAYGIKSFRLNELAESMMKKSEYIGSNYVDPRLTRIKFPSQKRNLVFIYLESLENSYLSRELGGYMDVNLMPELTELAREGVTFSDREKGLFGGPTHATGSQWSVAAMVNMSTGLPLKTPGYNRNAYGKDGYFMPGAYTLGEILQKQGYNQTIMFGAEAAFGGLDYFYSTHGNYKIFDIRYAQKNGLVDPNYWVWWGYEDEKLYDFAKQELTRLYQEGKPFNLTMETADTHFPDGWLNPKAPTPYQSQYANVIAYSTAQTVEFIRWIQQQPFYKDTTIVLIGDHPSMDKKFFADFDPNYKRTTFNVIINPAVDLSKVDDSRRYNRTWASFDMFPTILASLGCEIKGDRLGLGTNLFSGEQTLFERDGVDYVNKELEVNSEFYNTRILMSDEYETETTAANPSHSVPHSTAPSSAPHSEPSSAPSSEPSSKPTSSSTTDTTK